MTGLKIRAARLAFWGAEGVLWLWFLAWDATGAGNTTPVKFAAICLACLAALISAPRGRASALTAAALAVTVCADLFLLVWNTRYAVGVALFVGVQALYTLRLSPRKPWKGLLLRALPALGAGLLLNRWGLLTALPGAYILWFALNLADALRQAAARRGREEILFALGLGLFFCCDLCVGAHNLPPALLPGWLPPFAALAMWGFYLPGQVLIVSSVWKGTKP